jgi:hypothetical protein
MLLAGEDLRDRLIHLMGRGRLRVTTQALDEAGHRISRYLRAQLLVNASFGLAIGIGLYFIGIPNAVFWGLLGMVLRFLPYIGPWLAAGFPIALSLAVFESWTQPLLTIGLFVACELVSNNVVEPWLYGEHGNLPAGRHRVGAFLDVALGRRGAGAGDAADRVPRRGRKVSAGPRVPRSANGRQAVDRSGRPPLPTAARSQ